MDGDPEISMSAELHPQLLALLLLLLVVGRDSGDENNKDRLLLLLLAQGLMRWRRCAKAFDRCGEVTRTINPISDESRISFGLGLERRTTATVMIIISSSSSSSELGNEKMSHRVRHIVHSSL